MATKFVILNSSQQFLAAAGPNSEHWVNEYPDAAEYHGKKEVKRALRLAPSAAFVASNYGSAGEDIELASEF